jgi:hypothetical protein
VNAEDSDDELPFSFEELQTLSNEKRGFASGEMIACEKCRRMNPPTRAACLYCGAALPLSANQSARQKIILRSLESWEKGINIVLRPSASISEQATRAAIDALQLDVEQTRQIISYSLTHGIALPLVRVATNEETALVVKRLAKLEFDLEAVTDESLAVEKRPPTRIGALQPTREGVRAVLRLRGNANETNAAPQNLSMAWVDMVLIVAGRIIERRVDTAERHKGARKPSETIDSSEFFSDSSALDIYGIDRADERQIALHHWRIESGNFDFSTLEDFSIAKALTAAENFKRLVQLLRERAPHAVFDDEYTGARRLLDYVWQLDSKVQSRGLQRGRPGAFDTAASTFVSNEKQFTRYSRLRYYLMQSDSLRAAEE